MKVRQLEKNEKNVEALLRIDLSAFGKNLLNNWSIVPYLREGLVFGVFVNASIKGFVVYLKSWDESTFAYMAELAVEKDSQGKGIGSNLLCSSLEYLKRCGIFTVGLTVDPNNERALHVYSKFGFEQKEFRKNEYGEGLDRLFLCTDLRKVDFVKSNFR